VLLVLAVLAALAVAFASSPLPRITPDSASYLTGAEKLAEDGRFESCDGPITLFAPGYSAAMAPLVRLGLEAPDAARLVNVLATLLLVLGAGALAAGAGLSGRASAVVALAVAVSYVALRNGALVWSEPLFCALLAWLLVALVGDGRGLEVRMAARPPVALVLGWALLLTRHSGLFVLPAIVLAAWLGSEAQRHRLARVVAFSVALVALPAAWWLRNVHVDGAPFGRRSGSRSTAFEVLGQLPDGLSSLALPADLPLALRLVVAVPLVAAIVLSVRRGLRERRTGAAVSILATAVVAYTVGVTLAAMRTLVDPLDTRLLSPIFVPAVVLVAVGAASPRARLERALAAWSVAVVCVMAVLAPGVAWRGHEKARDLGVVSDEVSCARWPARYAGEEP